jgi:hypothetical protein
MSEQLMSEQLMSGQLMSDPWIAEQPTNAALGRIVN